MATVLVRRLLRVRLQLQADRPTCLVQRQHHARRRLLVQQRPHRVQRALQDQRVLQDRLMPHARRRTARFTLLPTRVVKLAQVRNMCARAAILQGQTATPRVQAAAALQDQALHREVTAAVAQHLEAAARTPHQEAAAVQAVEAEAAVATAEAQEAVARAVAAAEAAEVADKRKDGPSPSFSKQH